MGQLFIYLFTHSLVLSFIHPVKVLYGAPSTFQALSFSSCWEVRSNSQQVFFLSLLSLPNFHVHDHEGKAQMGTLADVSLDPGGASEALGEKLGPPSLLK